MLREEFYTLNSEPKAVILTKEPVPTKKWTIPSVIDKTLFEGEEWTIETEFREFLCDEKKSTSSNLNTIELYQVIVVVKPNFS